MKSADKFLSNRLSRWRNYKKMDYHSLPPAQLRNFVTMLLTVVGDEAPNAYGITAGEIAALTTGNTALGVSIDAVEIAKTTLHSKVVDKGAKRNTLVNAVSQAAKTAVANPAVTDTMLAAIGLPPRRSAGTPQAPVVPGILSAVPAVDGTVTLKWASGGNVSGTGYIIEQQSGEGDWTFLRSQTARRVKLDGYAPGQTVSFRVKATRKGLVSPASNVATIYPSTSGLSLKVAA